MIASTPTPGETNTLNLPPTVTLTGPAHGAVFQAPVDIALTATAGDSDGFVARVEFFADGEKAGQSLNMPFTATWSNAPPGAHVLFARAIDNRLGATASSNIALTILSQPPSVALTSPTNGAAFLSGSSVLLSANASDADGTVSVYQLSGAGQVAGIDLNFTTDTAVGGAGFGIASADVTCGPGGSSGAAELTEDGRDTFGLLTATDDVMFFQVVVPNEPFSIWLDGVAGLGKDADLYARYDQFPERNAWDFSSRKTGHSEEWIDIDAPQAGKILYVAVTRARAPAASTFAGRA